MNRKELLQAEQKKVGEDLKRVVGVWVLPSGRKHDSGWAKMDLVAEVSHGNETKRVRFGGYCDDIVFEGSHFRMDCDYPSRIIHVWNPRKFSVSGDGSSVYFTEERQ